jgi:hypothetical protein
MIIAMGRDHNRVDPSFPAWECNRIESVDYAEFGHRRFLAEEITGLQNKKDGIEK